MQRRSQFTQLWQIVFITIVLIGCSSAPNREKIIGVWETEETIEDADITAPSSLKVIITFQKDMTLGSDIIRDGKRRASYQGTYHFEQDEQHLVVYREGKNDRRNVAEIVLLNGTQLILADLSGSGDTLKLKRRR